MVIFPHKITLYLHQYPTLWADGCALYTQDLIDCTWYNQEKGVFLFGEMVWTQPFASSEGMVTTTVSYMYEINQFIEKVVTIMEVLPSKNSEN